MKNRITKAGTKVDSSTKADVTSVRQTIAKPPVGGSCRSFKNGQWLIRRWAKENGGETDFVRYEKSIDADRFEFSKFYRISKSKAENLTDCDDGLMPILKYFDYRMSLQFRPATKSEIQKYATLIMMS